MPNYSEDFWSRSYLTEDWARLLVQANVEIKSRLSIAPVQALHQAGIEISLPQRDRNFKLLDKQVRELFARDHPMLGKVK